MRIAAIIAEHLRSAIDAEPELIPTFVVNGTTKPLVMDVFYFDVTSEVDGRVYRVRVSDITPEG